MNSARLVSRTIPGKESCGLSLIELLVVMAIIGVLLSITIPAVQNAREAARRMDCTHNLKQLGLALHNYHEAYRRFPSALPAIFEGPSGEMGGGAVYSPLVHLLPYLDQAELFNSINFVTGPVVDRPVILNITVIATRVATFLCPSDHARQVQRSGPNSYRVNLGPRAGGPVHPYGPGAFDPWVWLSSADFSDGQSHTVAMSEKTRGDGNDSGFNPRTHYIFPVSTPFRLGEIPPDEALSACRSADYRAHQQEANGGSSWFFVGYGHTWYTHTSGPNPEFVDCSFQVPYPLTSIGYGLFPARSYHSGGVNVVFMDGSSRFIGNGVSLSVWLAISTRSGGETTSADQF